MNDRTIKYHALIVEDGMDYQRMISLDLKSLHHSFDIVSTQVDAEEKLSTAQYDYVILDLEIPCEKNSTARKDYGKNVAVFIRDKITTKKPAVLLLSSFATTKVTAQFMKGDLCDWVVIKSNFENDFISGINEMFANRHDENSACQHKAVFKLYKDELTIQKNGESTAPYISNNHNKIWQLFRGLARYSKCDELRGDCSIEYLATLGMNDIPQNVRKIRIRNKEFKIALKSINIGLEPKGIILTKREKKTSGYRLHEDFCIMDLTEEKVPETE